MASPSSDCQVLVAYMALSEHQAKSYDTGKNLEQSDGTGYMSQGIYTETVRLSYAVVEAR